jgi:hypothetical protein
MRQKYSNMQCQESILKVSWQVTKPQRNHSTQIFQKGLAPRQNGPITVYPMAPYCMDDPTSRYSPGLGAYDRSECRKEGVFLRGSTQT